MERLVFNRNLFTRHKEKDFSDDGTSFKCYYYKDKLPITVARWQDMAFVSIRLDYLGFKYDDYKEDYKILNMFNGCLMSCFYMDLLIRNCEFVIAKYGEAFEVEKEHEMIEGVMFILDDSGEKVDDKGFHRQYWNYIVDDVYEVDFLKVTGSDGKGWDRISISEDRSIRYLPEIYWHEDLWDGTKGKFVIQTTSYGSLEPSEIDKVIAGYQKAQKVVAALKVKFGETIKTSI